MDWAKSYAAHWRVYRVNRDTWADAEQVDNIDSVSITRTADGNLLESGSVEVTGDLAPDYYRIVLTAEQGSFIERVDVATLLFETKSGEYNYGVTSQDADGRSVLYPAATRVILDGEYAPAGVDGAKYAADMLRDAINAPVNVDGSFTLNDNVVHEFGTSVLEAVWAVLTAGGFVIQISGRGEVNIVERPTETALTIDSASLALFINSIGYSADDSAIPNRYIASNGEMRAIAINDSRASNVSTVARGYYVDEVDESPELINGETLSAYAVRRLHELSVLQDERTYTREYVPDVNLYDLITASADGINGNVRVISQSLTCGHGVTVQERVAKEIQLWV